MKNTSKIAVALAVVGVAAIAVTIARRIDTKRILTKISDEGYERRGYVCRKGQESQESSE